jgi:hypothetical protein
MSAIKSLGVSKSGEIRAGYTFCDVTDMGVLLADDSWYKNKDWVYAEAISQNEYDEAGVLMALRNTVEELLAKKERDFDKVLSALEPFSGRTVATSGQGTTIGGDEQLYVIRPFPEAKMVVTAFRLGISAFALSLNPQQREKWSGQIIGNACCP